MPIDIVPSVVIKGLIFRRVIINPLINPTDEMKNKLKTWPALTDEQTQQFNTAYAAVTGS